MSISHESVHEWWENQLNYSDKLNLANMINDQTILDKAYNELSQEQQDLVLNTYYQKQDYFNPNEEEELGVMSNHSDHGEDKGWSSYPAGTASFESKASEYIITQSNGQRMFECPVCGIFIDLDKNTTYDTLKGHLSGSHNVMDWTDEDMKSLGKESKATEVTDIQMNRLEDWISPADDYNSTGRMKCDICGKIFESHESEDLMYDHLKNTHETNYYQNTSGSWGGWESKANEYNPMAFINKQLGIKTKANEDSYESPMLKKGQQYTKDSFVGFKGQNPTIAICKKCGWEAGELSDEFNSNAPIYDKVREHVASVHGLVQNNWAESYVRKVKYTGNEGISLADWSKYQDENGWYRVGVSSPTPEIEDIARSMGGNYYGISSDSWGVEEWSFHNYSDAENFAQYVEGKSTSYDYGDGIGVTPEEQHYVEGPYDVSPHIFTSSGQDINIGSGAIGGHPLRNDPFGVGEAIRGKYDSWKKQDIDVRDETLDFAGVNADIKEEILSTDMTLDEIKDGYPEEFKKLEQAGVWGFGESLTAGEQWSDEQWLSEVEKLASGSGVKTIPVENFLMTLEGQTKVQAEMNFESDASVYGWNGETQEAISKGISKYFSKESEATEGNIDSELEEYFENWDSELGGAGGSVICRLDGVEIDVGGIPTMIGAKFKLLQYLKHNHPNIGNRLEKKLYTESKAKEVTIHGQFFDQHFEEEYVTDQDGMYLCKDCGARLDTHNIQTNHSPEEVARHHMETEHGLTESKANEENPNHAEDGKFASGGSKGGRSGLNSSQKSALDKYIEKHGKEDRDSINALAGWGMYTHLPADTLNEFPDNSEANPSDGVDEEEIYDYIYNKTNSKANEDYDYRDMDQGGSSLGSSMSGLDGYGRGKDPYDWFDGQGEFIIDTVKQDLYQAIVDSGDNGVYYNDINTGWVLGDDHGWETVKAREELEREGKIRKGSRYDKMFEGGQWEPHGHKEPSDYYFAWNVDFNRTVESKATESIEEHYQDWKSSISSAWLDKTEDNWIAYAKSMIGYSEDEAKDQWEKWHYLTKPINESKTKAKEVAEKLAYYFNKGDKPIDWNDNQVSNEAERILQETYGITTKKPEVAKEVAHESHSPIQEKIIDRKLSGVKSDGIVHELMLWENMSEEQATKAVESTEIPIMDSVSFSLFNKKYSQLTEVEKQEIKLYGGEVKKVNKSREGV